MCHLINVTRPMLLSYISYSHFLCFWNCECLNIPYPIDIPWQCNISIIKLKLSFCYNIFVFISTSENITFITVFTAFTACVKKKRTLLFTLSVTSWLRKNEEVKISFEIVLLFFIYIFYSIKEQVLIVPCAAAHISFLRLFGWTGRRWHFMETRICQDYILKVPGSSIHQTYGLMQLRDVCYICKEMGYISTEYFDVNKERPAVMLPAF